jgi:hypothetical protein
MDWHEWHRDYDDPTSTLSRRLEMVQREIAAALDRLPNRPWHVISLCVGDGRDLLGVLDGHPRSGDVSGLMIELDPDLAAVGRAAYTSAGLADIEVRTGDAGDAAHYAGHTADLLLVCGVFGNLSDSGVSELAARLPGLCEQGATVIWTRHRKPPDLTVVIRQTLTSVGFTELSVEPVPESWGTVGAARYDGPLVGFDATRRLFEFRSDRTQSWKQPPA